MLKTLTFEILNELEKEFGGAFYLLESEHFKENYKELTKAFKQYYPKFNIAYSYKTNYTPKIVKIVNRLGGYAEVVSDMEMEIAIRSGVCPDKIIWNGPIKNKEKMKELLLKGGTVNIDSIYEMDDIMTIARDHPDHTLNVGVRCNFDIGDSIISRFGFDEGGPDFNRAFNSIASIPNIHFAGLQVHFAKRDPELWAARTEGILRIYDNVLKNYGLKSEYLDIGGGIYGKMPDSLCSQLGIGRIVYDDYAFKSARVFAEHFKGVADTPWLFIEPGSALAGDSMRFVCRVETIKKIRGKTIATTTGSQKNISMSGLNPPMEIISAGGQGEVINADITGYTCIEGDILQKDYTGPLAVGDYIIIENCGSYSLVMKPPFIFPNYPVVDISGDGLEIIKRAENFEDLFKTFAF